MGNEYAPPWAALVKAAETRHMSQFRLGEIGRCVIAAEAERVALVAEVERLRALVDKQREQLDEVIASFRADLDKEQAEIDRLVALADARQNIIREMSAQTVTLLELLGKELIEKAHDDQ